MCSHQWLVLCVCPMLWCQPWLTVLYENIIYKLIKWEKLVKCLLACAVRYVEGGIESYGAIGILVIWHQCVECTAGMPYHTWAEFLMQLILNLYLLISKILSIIPVLTDHFSESSQATEGGRDWRHMRHNWNCAQLLPTLTVNDVLSALALPSNSEDTEHSTAKAHDSESQVFLWPNCS